MTASGPQRTDENARSELRATLRQLTAAWRNRRYEELSGLFDDHMVMMLPGLSGRLEGRDAVVDSYREFMESATVSECAENALAIDVWGHTAVAWYHWEMTWVTGEKSDRAAGYDVLVFSHRTDGDRPWRAIWRTMALDVPYEHRAGEH